MKKKRQRWWSAIAITAVAAGLGLAGLTSAGCANVTQSEECKQYVDCLAARDTQLKLQTDYKRFTVEGGCWGNPEGADLCTRACKNGSAWLKKSYTDLPTACK